MKRQEHCEIIEVFFINSDIIMRDIDMVYIETMKIIEILFIARMK